MICVTLGRARHTRMIAEHQFLDRDETEHVAMANAARVDLVDLALTHKYNFKKGFLAHPDVFSRFVQWRSAGAA